MSSHYPLRYSLSRQDVSDPYLIDENPNLRSDSSAQLPMPLKIPWLLWLVLIIIQGTLYCVEPEWSILAVTLSVSASAFLISAITNARWTLIVIFLITTLFPVRLFTFNVSEYITLDITLLSILSLLFLRWIVYTLEGVSPISSTPLDKWFVALFFLIILNCMISQYAAASINMWQYFILTGPLLFLMVYRFFEEGKQIRDLLALIIAVVTITGVYMVIESYLEYNPIYNKIFLTRGAHYNPAATFYRATGFSGHPVTSGIAFSLVVPFAVFGALYAASLPRRILWGFASMFLILGAIAASARGTILTILFALILMLFRSWKTLIYALTTLTLIAIVAWNTGLLNFVFVRLDPRYLAQDVSLWHRILMHWSAWNIFKDYPIFGAGLISMIKLYPQYKHPLDILNFVVVDNQFLTFLYGTGTVGMIILLGLFSKIPIWILRRPDEERLPIMRKFQWTGFVSILAFYLNSLNFDSMCWSYSQILFWFVSALLMRLSALPNNELICFLKLYGYDENSLPRIDKKDPPIHQPEGTVHK